jgi:hypothetical protein
MFQHLESGGSLALNKQGQLETQGAAGRFFQKIGDAFRSITSSGRAAIETRNANLHVAMANMLRDNTLINPAGGEISPPATPAERNALAMRLGVVLGLNKFPEESRAAAQNLGLQLLHLPGVLGPNDSPAQIRGKALEVMNKIRHNDVVCYALLCNYTRTYQQLQPQLDEIGADVRETFTAQKDRYVNENGIHTGCFSDASRNVSINGAQVLKNAAGGADKADFTAKLTEMVPNEKSRAFVTTMLTQAGLLGSVLFQAMQLGQAKDNPFLPGDADLRTKGFQMDNPHHHCDISVADGKVRIKQEVDITIKSMNGLHEVASALGIDCDRADAHTRGRGQPIGGGRYTVEMEIDLNQDMTDKEIPEFRLVNASREPLPIPPPVV